MNRYLSWLLNAALVAVIFLSLAVASGRAYEVELVRQDAGRSALTERDQGQRDASRESDALLADGRSRGAKTRQATLDPNLSPRSASVFPFVAAGRTASLRAIRQVFGRRSAAAIRVSSCETGGTFNARAVGRHGERGLFQIHPVHFGWAQPARLFDPVWNSRVAYRLSRGGTSWRAWSCRP